VEAERGTGVLELGFGVGGGGGGGGGGSSGSTGVSGTGLGIDVAEDAVTAVDWTGMLILLFVFVLFDGTNLQFCLDNTGPP
jgi:hypothetical protein